MVYDFEVDASLAINLVTSSLGPATLLEPAGAEFLKMASWVFDLYLLA